MGLFRARSALTLALLGHAAMSLSLFSNDGNRDFTGIALVLVAIAAWGAAFAKAIARGRLGERDGAAPPDHGAGAQGEADPIVWYAALGSTLLVFLRAPGYHVQTGLGFYHLLASAVVALVASYAIDLHGGAPVNPVWAGARRALLFALAFTLGAWILRASPDPLIDLFPVHQQTAQAMLDGKSIYEPGVISVLDTNHHTFVIRAYTYLPLSAYLTTIAYALTHDIRWANLVGFLTGGVLLWVVARRSARDGNAANAEAAGSTARLTPETWADLVAAGLLFFPRALVVIEKAWTEPLALPCLGGFVLFALARRPVAASVCLGLLCAIKQHLVLYVPFLVLVPGVGFGGLVLAGAVALVTMMPYLLRAPLDLYHGAFGNIVSGPFRTDALTVPAELSVVGVIVPTWVGFVAGLVPFAWLRRTPRELAPLLLGSCLVFGFFYAFGRQAFLNYYFLLDATALFAVATLRAPRPVLAQASRPER